MTKSTTGYGVASLVIGVVAVLLSLIAGGAGLIPGVIGLAFAYDGRRWVRRGLRSGGGIAMAGLVLNWIAVVIGLLHLIANLLAA